MVDKEKIKEAVTLLLEGIGEDTGREGLKDTPERIARMYEEIFAGMDQDSAVHLARTFSSGHTGIVLERDIDFYSMCEHHMLPFFGKAHVAYIPDGKVVGLSKIARTVEVYARRLQIQEQMGVQIADALVNELGAKGAMVMLEAEHTCMTMRGVKKPGTRTVTVATKGVFDTDDKYREEFYKMMAGTSRNGNV